MKTIWKLQLVENVGIMLLMGASYLDYMTLLLQVLQWLPVSFWAEFRVLIFTFKAPNALGLGHCLLPYECAYLLRSAREALLCIPSVSDSWLAGTQEKVSAVATKLCNLLPRAIWLAPSLLAVCTDVNIILVGFRLYSASLLLLWLFC